MVERVWIYWGRGRFLGYEIALVSLANLVSAW